MPTNSREVADYKDLLITLEALLVTVHILALQYQSHLLGNRYQFLTKILIILRKSMK